MKSLIFITLLLVVSVFSSDEEKTSFDEMHMIAKRFIDWGQVDLGCTISCGAYWTCIFKTDGKSCKSPPNCECSQFAGK
uniref:Uncharacterized protein n=1 Tax=Acrobeloides nanus TaxID=290746 RepID=A0A914CP72_9BILA